MQDHPRTCGENFNETVDGDVRAGSPPHLRGKLIACAPALIFAGITPAPAGKTSHIVKHFNR